MHTKISPFSNDKSDSITNADESERRFTLPSFQKQQQPSKLLKLKSALAARNSSDHTPLYAGADRAARFSPSAQISSREKLLSLRDCVSRAHGNLDKKIQLKDKSNYLEEIRHLPLIVSALNAKNVNFKLSAHTSAKEAIDQLATEKEPFHRRLLLCESAVEDEAPHYTYADAYRSAGGKLSLILLDSAHALADSPAVFKVHEKLMMAVNERDDKKDLYIALIHLKTQASPYDCMMFSLYAAKQAETFADIMMALHNESISGSTDLLLRGKVKANFYPGLVRKAVEGNLFKDVSFAFYMGDAFMPAPFFVPTHSQQRFDEILSERERVGLRDVGQIKQERNKNIEIWPTEQKPDRAFNKTVDQFRREIFQLALTHVQAEHDTAYLEERLGLVQEKNRVSVTAEDDIRSLDNFATKIKANSVVAKPPLHSSEAAFEDAYHALSSPVMGYSLASEKSNFAGRASQPPMDLTHEESPAEQDPHALEQILNEYGFQIFGYIDCRQYESIKYINYEFMKGRTQLHKLSQINLNTEIGPYALSINRHQNRIFTLNKHLKTKINKNEKKSIEQELNRIVAELGEMRRTVEAISEIRRRDFNYRVGELYGISRKGISEKLQAAGVYLSNPEEERRALDRFISSDRAQDIVKKVVHASRHFTGKVDKKKAIERAAEGLIREAQRSSFFRDKEARIMQRLGDQRMASAGSDAILVSRPELYQVLTEASRLKITETVEAQVKRQANAIENRIDRNRAAQAERVEHTSQIRTARFAQEDRTRATERVTQGATRKAAPSAILGNVERPTLAPVGRRNDVTIDARSSEPPVHEVEDLFKAKIGALLAEVRAENEALLRALATAPSGNEASLDAYYPPTEWQAALREMDRSVDKALTNANRLENLILSFDSNA